MAITRINYGAAPDDGTGDPLRTAFQKTDNNFVDLDGRKAEQQDVADALAGKVDKVAGKQLSTEDFTTVEKQKLDAVQPNATANRPDSQTDTLLAEKADQSAVDAALALKADAADVAQAIAMATTFTAVPTTFQAWCVVVTQPHIRVMIWNGTKYVRAPWHQPGVIFYSDGPAVNVTHGIQMRGDVTYNTADYPDLAEFYGFTGPTFVLNDARARVIRSADLGRGIDAALVNGYLQEDAIRDITGWLNAAGGYGFDVFENATGAFSVDTSLHVGWVAATQQIDVAHKMAAATFSASRVVPTAGENRVKSLIATPYVTI